MLLHVICLRNKGLKCFCNPIFDDHEPEVFAKSLERFILSDDKGNANQYKKTAVYWIGTFNDETGEFKAIAPELLLDCDDVFAVRKDPEDEKV